MEEWLTPEVAAALMLIGAVPPLTNVYLLYDDRQKPGILWFLVSMAVGGLWAFLFGMFTLVPSPEITLALANFFWTIIPAAAVSMFLLAYEFVFKTTVSRRFALCLYAPVILFFLLTWINPADLIFAADYHVDADGILHFSAFGGVLRVAVVQVYGYLLVFLAAGMFVGEVMRTSGIQRQQSIYLLVIFSALVISTIVKVVDLVPIYYDPTPTVYGLAGLLVAYSWKKHGLLKNIPGARDQNFELIGDMIIVVDADNTIIDINRAGRRLFGSQAVGEPIEEILSSYTAGADANATQTVQLEIDGKQRYFSLSTSSIDYGRGLEGETIIMSDITVLKEQEEELMLLKEVLLRIFRHNIRNDITIINGCARQIKEQADDQIAALADEIDKTSLHLVNQSEKARTIENVIMNDVLVTGSLWESVEKALSTCESDETVVLRSAVEDVFVEFHPKFHLAIQELVENAIIHHETESDPEIELYSESTENGVVLVVEDNGPGIPRSEIDILHAEEETSLQHGSGIGLWLVRWIVDHSNGELRVETTDTGSRIEIPLSKVKGAKAPE